MVDEFRHGARPFTSFRRIAARSAARDQMGSTLIEVIIAVFLVSLVVLGLATAFVSLMRINRANAEQQRVDHAVDNVAELAKAVEYVASGDRAAGYSDPLRLGLPTTTTDGVTIRLVGVECRIPGAAPTSDLYGPCGVTDSGTQRITVRGEYRDRSRNAQVVVRTR